MSSTAAADVSCDLLLDGGTVITLDGDKRVIDNGAVAVAGNRIVAVGDSTELEQYRRATKRSID